MLQAKLNNCDSASKKRKVDHDHEVQIFRKNHMRDSEQVFKLNKSCNYLVLDLSFILLKDSQCIYEN